jgi:hypothetical protein
MSNVLTQYWGTIYELKPGGKVGCGVGPMADGEILWAAAIPIPFGINKKCMVVNLTNKMDNHGEHVVTFEVVNTGQFDTTFKVYFAWTDVPTDF